MKRLGELQLGKAGEYLVCADLISRGYNAFLSNQGSAFDVVVETSDGLRKVQVKTTRHPKKISGYMVYRFGITRGKHGLKSARLADVDWFAFVRWDSRTVAYVPSSEIKASAHTIKMTIDFRSRDFKYKGRKYSNGTRRSAFGRFFETYDKFKV